MASKQYHQSYWKRYKKRARQVSITLSHEEYTAWEKRAKKHGQKFVGQQIKAEALAYQDGVQIPTAAMENWLSELSRVWRGIATNINQIAHHSNSFERLVLETEAIELLKLVEQKSRAFVTKAQDQKSNHR